MQEYCDKTIVEGLKDKYIVDNKTSVNRLIYVSSLTPFHHWIVYMCKGFGSLHVHYEYVTDYHQKFRALEKKKKAIIFLTTCLIFYETPLIYKT